MVHTNLCLLSTRALLIPMAYSYYVHVSAVLYCCWNIVWWALLYLWHSTIWYRYALFSWHIFSTTMSQHILLLPCLSVCLSVCVKFYLCVSVYKCTAVCSNWLCTHHSQLSTVSCVSIELLTVCNTGRPRKCTSTRLSCCSLNAVCSATSLQCWPWELKLTWFWNAALLFGVLLAADNNVDGQTLLRLTENMIAHLLSTIRL